MTDAIARQALHHWSMDNARITLVAARENAVYRVDTSSGPIALRLHRPGLRSRVELQSELEWMAALGASGLTLPRPIPADDGRLYVMVAGTVIDVLTWLDGVPMGRDGRLVLSTDVAGAYRKLGGLMARLHDISDRWQRPEGFTRPAWDVDGLLGDHPLWGRFWENPHLEPAQVCLLEDARVEARRRLMDVAPGLDYGLIHADLVPDNVMVCGEALHLIDFDDGGFGFRIFDLATTLNRAMRTDNYPVYREALLEGYGAERTIDLACLPLFQALRAFTYVGWIVPRLEEPGAHERNRNFIADACRMANDVLGLQGGGV